MLRQFIGTYWVVCLFVAGIGVMGCDDNGGSGVTTMGGTAGTLGGMTGSTMETGGAGGSATGGAGGTGTGGNACVESAACTQADGKKGVCRANACTGCTDVTDDAVCATAFGAGNICEAGQCIQGDCHTNAECQLGKVCQGNTCAPCTASAQCGAGKVCDLVKGSCEVGNCGSKADCANGQTCNNAYACGACASSQACKDQYGPTYICLTGGTCAVGDCNTTSDCAGGKVCNTTTHLCEACSTTAACTAASGYGNDHVCVSGACVSGNCTTLASDCSDSEVCGETVANRCGACKTDGACVGRYGAGQICVNGDCVAGTCHNSGECTNGQYCDPATHNCATCTNDAAGDNACRASGLGANTICLDSKCVTGNCHDLTSECSSNGQICGSQVAHTCGDCSDGATGDTQCKSAYDSSHICLSSRCVVGNCHDNSSDCQATNEVCNKATHSCAGCGSGPAGDSLCKTEYGDGYLCVANKCVVADCHSSNDCAAGQICGAVTPNVCGGCDTGAAGDAQCAADARYVTNTSPGYLCINSLCTIGECHPGLSDCQAKGTVCSSATNLCTACTANAQCTAEPGYGTDYMCFVTPGQSQTGQCVSTSCQVNGTACSANSADFCCGNKCVQGNCCADSDCTGLGFGYTCVANNCTSCDAVAANKYVVDPANGSDSATGSGKSSGNSSNSCALKSVTRALALIKTAFPGGAPAGTTITVIGKQGGQDLVGETYPLVIPANVVIATSAGPVTAKVPAGRDGISLTGSGGGINAAAGAEFIVDGTNKTSRYGVFSNVASIGVTLNNVTVQNTGNEGVYFTGASIALNSTGLLAKNVTGRGIYVTGTAASVNLTSTTVEATTAAALRFNGPNSIITIVGLTVQNTTGYGIHFAGAGSTATISGSTVSTTGNSGMLIASTGTVSLSGSAVRNTHDAGIVVQAGVLNIGAGVTIENAGTSNPDPGIYANANAVVNIAVPAGGAPTRIINNTSYGLMVRGDAVLNITGVPNADGTTGTVIVDGNVQNNIDIRQSANTPVACNINGAVVTNGGAHGMYVSATSKLKLRNSKFTYNTLDGVRVDGAVNADGLDNIDLGANVASDPGNNVLQVSGEARNRRSGLCVNMSNNQNVVASAGSLTLKASGNIFAGQGAPTGGVNCALATPAALAFPVGWNTGCPASADLGLPNRTGTTTAVLLDNCVIP